MTTPTDLAQALRDAEATMLAFLGDVAFDGSLCGMKQAVTKAMFASLLDRLNIHESRAQPTIGSDADAFGHSHSTVLAAPAQPASVADGFSQVIEKLRRCYECWHDGADACVGREWLDALTTIGAMERIQRSPAQWAITPVGEAMLASAGANGDRVTKAVLAFADFLHRMDDEDGWEVGPMRVKWDAHGQLADGPLWVGSDDTRRWAETFLAAAPQLAKERE